MAGLSRAYKRRPKGLPLSIPGLQLWLDASDASTLFQNSNGTTAATADGDPVGYWGDKSGNARSFSQNDGTRKPTFTQQITQNNKPGIIGDGVGDYLQSAASGFLVQPHTYFLVVKTFSTSRLIDRIVDGLNDAGNLGGWESAKWVMYSGIATFSGTRTTSTTLVTAKFDGSFSSLRTNGSLNFGPVNIGTANPTTMTVFGKSTDTGYLAIYEFLAYNSISDANRNLIESYLNAKWSIF